LCLAAGLATHEANAALPSTHNGLGGITNGQFGVINGVYGSINGANGGFNSMGAVFNGQSGPMNGLGGPLNGAGGGINGAGGGINGMGTAVNSMNGGTNGMQAVFNGHNLGSYAYVLRTDVRDILWGNPMTTDTITMAIKQAPELFCDSNDTVSAALNYFSHWLATVGNNSGYSMDLTYCAPGTVGAQFGKIDFPATPYGLFPKNDGYAIYAMTGLADTIFAVLATELNTVLAPHSYMDVGVVMNSIGWASKDKFITDHNLAFNTAGGVLPLPSRLSSSSSGIAAEYLTGEVAPVLSFRVQIGDTYKLRVNAPVGTTFDICPGLSRTCAGTSKTAAAQALYVAPTTLTGKTNIDYSITLQPGVYSVFTVPKDDPDFDANVGQNLYNLTSSGTIGKISSLEADVHGWRELVFYWDSLTHIGKGTNLSNAGPNCKIGIKRSKLGHLTMDFSGGTCLAVDGKSKLDGLPLFNTNLKVVPSADLYNALVNAGIPPTYALTRISATWNVGGSEVYKPIATAVAGHAGTACQIYTPHVYLSTTPGSDYDACGNNKVPAVTVRLSDACASFGSSNKAAVPYVNQALGWTADNKDFTMNKCMLQWSTTSPPSPGLLSPLPPSSPFVYTNTSAAARLITDSGGVAATIADTYPRSAELLNMNEGPNTTYGAAASGRVLVQSGYKGAAALDFGIQRNVNLIKFHPRTDITDQSWNNLTISLSTDGVNWVQLNRNVATVTAPQVLFVAFPYTASIRYIQLQTGNMSVPMDLAEIETAAISAMQTP